MYIKKLKKYIIALVFIATIINISTGTEVEVRTPRSSNSWAVSKGAYIGYGVVITSSNAVSSTTGGNPLVLFPGSSKEYQSYATAISSSKTLAALRVNAPSSIKATSISSIRFDDREKAEAFIDNLFTEWGIQTKQSNVVPTSSGRSVYVKADNSEVEKLTKDIEDIESVLALIRAKLSIVEMDAGTAIEIKNTVDALQGRMSAIEQDLASCHQRVNELSDSNFRLVVTFPSGEKYEGTVKSNGGLLELDFSNFFPQPKE